MMITTRARVFPGDLVVGSDAKLVGQVRAVREDGALVKRTPMPDLVVPFEAMAEIGEDLIVLSVPADDADSMSWLTVD